MKNRITQLTLGTASAALLTVGAAAPASAAVTDVTDGHVDVVEISCLDGVYEVATHIEGVGEVDPADIGDYEFLIDAQSSFVDYAGGTYTVDHDSASEIPDLGFEYDWKGGACANSLDVAWSVTSGPGNVQFDGANSVTLTKNAHTHAEWTYAGATPGVDNDYTLGFVVITPDGNVAVSPVNVTIQP